jgi:hypothetical protein
MTLGVLVVLFSFGLAGSELAGVELNRIALPLGLALFAAVLGIRVWARSDRPADYVKPLAIEEG